MLSFCRYQLFKFRHRRHPSFCRYGIYSTLQELVVRAFKEDQEVGHLDLSKFRLNTHSERKGGASFLKARVHGIDWFIQWLGGWKSLAFLVYAQVTSEAVDLSFANIAAKIGSLFV